MNIKAIGTVLLLMIWSSALLAQSTTVYKKRMPDGSIQFSDQPSQNAETMQVEPVPTIPALRTAPPEQATKQATEAKELYAVFRFLEPENGASVWSGNGSVAVKLEVQPQLMGDHSIQISIDGQILSQQQSLELVVPGIERGTHQIEAAILDFRGKAIKTISQTITVHRPSVLR